jgi:hypothetical protein
VKETADRLAQQHDSLGAATIYETLVTEIFAHSHLYAEEEAEYDDYAEEESYDPEEEGLAELVEASIEALGSSLAIKQTDRIAREKIIAVLFAIYQRDMHAYEGHGFAERVADQLVQFTTPLERRTLAGRVDDILNDEEGKVPASWRRAYGGFLLNLEQETLDDEAYLRMSRQTGRTSDLIDRLLTLGRIDEAVRETRHVDDLAFLVLVDLFVQHGQDGLAERLVSERINENPALHLLEWLRTYYRERGN